MGDTPFYKLVDAVELPLCLGVDRRRTGGGAIPTGGGAIPTGGGAIPTAGISLGGMDSCVSR
ncbi:MAG: hypothetical protein ABGY24_03520 [bacterium]